MSSFSFFIFILFFHTTSFSQHQLHIEISSINLSEDYSPLSTKNDELLLFVFQKNKNQCVELFSNEFTFDSTLKAIAYSTTITNYSDSLYFFLIEIDSDATTQSIKKKVLLNFDNIIFANLNLDIRKIKKFLDDEDIISARKIYLEEEKSALSFTESNFNLLDKFEYNVRISITTF